MKFTEKIKRKCDDLYSERPLTLAFLGDSVTQGCFHFANTTDGTVQTIFESEYAYHAIIRKIFGILYPTLPTVIINAGISGDTAPQGAERLERDVLSYKPDLVVVCYGLNDHGYGEETLGDYKNALVDIFTRVKNSGAELIFMTPNMVGERVNGRVPNETLRAVAERMVGDEKQACLDLFLDSARKICEEMDVPVCDCHKNWKVMKNAGVDITNLLSNDINHPIKELHYMFAYELVKLMLSLD